LVFLDTVLISSAQYQLHGERGCLVIFPKGRGKSLLLTQLKLETDPNGDVTWCSVTLTKFSDFIKPKPY
jgi:hypothetical protein